MVGMGHKTSNKGNLAISINFFNYVCFDTAAQILGNYPMDMFTHIINILGPLLHCCV